ncbi:MAG TPA: Ig-like domain-containing protein [Thermoanaerobaculia bacterium]|nr:Ig-like domain-containing protein [Thermoanaerobaculia bacterium]
MGRRQIFLLLLVLYVCASFVSAPVSGASVSFLRARDGQTTDFVLSDTAIVVRVDDASYNLNPAAVETLGVSISLMVSEDSEAMILKETGPDTGVFEGSIHHVSNFMYRIMGDGLLVSSTSASFLPDTVRVQHEAPTFVDAQAPLTASVTRLVDEDGADADSFALGSELRVQVETARETSPSLDVKTVQVRSLATGDLETLRVWETDKYSLLFTRALPIVPGAAVPGDGKLQAQPGETVEVEHDADGVPSSDQAVVARSAVRFVDEAGLPVAVLVEEGTARVRVLDPLSAGQAPPAATIRSRITLDVEPLGLAELPGSPGLFEGSIPMRLGNGSGGVLGTGRESSGEPDTITAGDGQAAASLPIVPALLEIVDDQGRPRTSASAGDTLRIRATVLRPDPDAVPGYVMVLVSSLEYGHSQHVFLPETGASTGIFEGTVPAVRPGASAPSPLVYVETTDTVEVAYNDSTYPADPNGRAETAIAIVPVAVELLDGQGAATESYLYGDTLHVRIAEPDANANPAAAETVTATVTARRYGDAMHDVETAILLETGPDTDVFTGTLPTAELPGYSDSPVPGNGVVEFPKNLQEPDSESRVTASRSGASATARVRDSKLWLADEEGRDATVFPVGSVVHVWLRRPASNVSAGIDAPMVAIWTRTNDADSEGLILIETGADTGLFTASILVQQGVPADGNGVLTGQVGDAFEVLFLVDGSIMVSADIGYLGEPSDPSGNQPPHANDDFPYTYEETPVNHIVLANDVDPDGDPLTLTAVTQGANGSVAIEGDDSVTYTPNEGFSGSDTFTYTVSAEGGTDTGTVYVTVFGTNDPPDAVDDSAATDEETPVVIAVKANDSDPDGDPLTVVAVGTQAANGYVDINADGTITYTPYYNFFGETVFTYTVSDGIATDTASVTVMVAPADDPPVADGDGATTNEETAVVIAVKANDYDPDGDAITVTAVTQPVNGSGTVVLNADETVTYTPNPDYHGSDGFTYTLTDSGGSTATGSVLLAVNPVNDPPVAVDDAVTTNEDMQVNFPVKNNDTDPDGDTLSVASVTQGAKGTVVINQSPGAFHWLIYLPHANANGSDTFTYTISDNRGGTDTATVTVTITPVNDTPRAFNDSVTTAEDTPLTFDPRINDTDPDGDALTVTSASDPNRGSTVVNANGTVTYTPDANLSGTDLFVYAISDGNGGTWSALVTVTVTPVNDVPDARNDLPLTNEDTPVTINVLSNDVDADGHTLTVTALTQPAKGTAVLNANNTITYTPNLNTNGSDSFTYTISDGNGGTDTATVSLSVIPVNDPPVAVADSATVAEEGTVTTPVAANDTDPENSTLTVTAVTQGAHGTVTLLAGNQVRYQPAANYFGPDTFTYTVRDPGNLTSTGTVNVTVTPVNDPPVANADSGGTQEDVPVALFVLSNDTDPDGDTLTVVSVTQSANGSVDTNGTLVSFTPAANWNGTAFFTYTIRDAGGVERTANVTITVNPVNDPPLAGPDTANTNENAPVTVSVLVNDADVDGGALSVSAVTQGANGAVATNGITVTYTPAAGFSGADSFTYNVSDGFGGTATGLVTVTVNEVNGAPVANPDSGSTREGVAVIIAVLANDTDGDGDALTVTAVGSPGVLLPDNTVRYTPGANFTGTVTFSYTVSDGQGGTANGQVTVVVGEALERVAILATNSAALRTGSDVLSGDVIVNQAGAGPFLNGAELSIGGSVTTAANWDVEADSLTVAAGAVVGGDVSYNQLTNGGTINGLQRSPLALPVFPALPAFLTATPGTTTINVANNGTRTLAPGSYLDLVVGRKGTVTFTGGTYHFRSITVDREAKLLFSDASQVRVQQKLSTKNLTMLGPATGAPIDASSIVFYVAGINGTTGTLAATPKAVEIGTSNTVAINLYAPNGTTWLQDGTLATGAFLGKDIDVGLNVQVALDSAW